TALLPTGVMRYARGVRSWAIAARTLQTPTQMMRRVQTRLSGIAREALSRKATRHISGLRPARELKRMQESKGKSRHPRKAEGTLIWLVQGLPRATQRRVIPEPDASTATSPRRRATPTAIPLWA